MKRIYILFLIILFVAIVVFGLGFFNRANAPVIDEEQRVNEVPEQLSYTEEVINEEDEKFSINIKYPKTNNQAINNEINNFIESSVNKFKSDADEFGDLPDYLKERKYRMDIWFNFYESSKYKSFVFLTSTDTLGAHPNSFYNTLNFDNDSKSISITDFLVKEFNDLNVIDDISAISYVKLERELGKDAMETGWVEDGVAPEIENFQDFYVLEDKIVFLFEPYAIGPYAWSSKEVEVRFDELNTLEEF